MPKDICIVHIEDEFPHMRPFPSKMKDYVEQYWNDRDGGDNFTVMREIKQKKNGESDWVVYEIACPKGSAQKIRYIFVGPEEIPDEVAKYFVERPYFIIDVLRPAPKTQKLWATGDQSIASAARYGGTAETITIFTACQGGDLLSLLASHPGIGVISKANIQDFSRLICRIVVQGMSDG